MAEVASDTTSKDAKKAPKKKKGLFSFLWRGKKRRAALDEDLANDTVTPSEPISQADDASSDAPNDVIEADEASQPGPRRKKTTARKPRKTTSKAGAKSATGKKAAPKKKPAAKKSAAKKSTKPRTRGKTKSTQQKQDIASLQNQEVLDAQIPATKVDSEAEDAPSPKTKKSFFRFLKRKKSHPKPEPLISGVESTDSAAKEVAADVDSDSGAKKKGLFGFLKRKGKSKKQTLSDQPVSANTQSEASDGSQDKSDTTEIAPDGAAAMSVGDGVELSQVKKGKFAFLRLSRKLVIIIIGSLSVTGAAGAAAIVFVKPMVFGEDVPKMMCTIAYQTKFVVMKEKRVQAFVRSADSMPRDRLTKALTYAKFLAKKYDDSNLITVSWLSENGPENRIDFRGSAIGAQVVFAPNPLMTMATNKPWEARYVNVDAAAGGYFIGDRFELSLAEIEMISNDIEMPQGCMTDEAQEDAKPDDEEGDVVEAADVSEEAAEDTSQMSDQPEASDMMAPDGEMVADDADMMAAEPGFLDNILAMVGLGGSDGDMDDPNTDMMDMAAQTDELIDMSGADADADMKESGLFDGLLSAVGLGGNEEDVADAPKTLGTKIRYN